jgi:hypothetical protein
MEEGTSDVKVKHGKGISGAPLGSVSKHKGNEEGAGRSVRGASIGIRVRLRGLAAAISSKAGSYTTVRLFFDEHG